MQQNIVKHNKMASVACRQIIGVVVPIKNRRRRLQIGGGAYKLAAARPAQGPTPVSTGILPHSLPEWAFRARPGLWRNCLYPKVARIAEQKFGSRYRAKLGQRSFVSLISRGAY